MSSSPSSRCTTVGASARELLDVLAPALVEHDHDALLHVVRHRRTLDLGVLPLDPGEAAIDHLVGSTAPRHWQAIGLVTSGTAMPLPDGHAEDRQEESVDSCRHRGRIRLALLADRSGSVVSSVYPADRTDDPVPVEATHDHQPTGWVVDVCRRVLGLPTAPAEHAVSAWLDLVWLDALVSAVTAAPARRWSWSEVAALHPLQPADATTPPELAAATRQAEAETSWTRLRLLLARGSTAGAGAPGDASITVELASWLDDGAFARHLVSRFPPAEVLLGVLSDLLPTGAVRAVHAALADPPTRRAGR